MSTNIQSKYLSRYVLRGLSVLFAGILLAALAVVPGSAQVPEICITIPPPVGVATCTLAIQFSGAGAPSEPRYGAPNTLTKTCPGLIVNNQIPGVVASEPDAKLIMGTEGDDILQGSPGPDCIFGLGGNDIIFADAGFDDVYGGPGNDFIYGGSGDEYVEGDPCSGAPGTPNHTCTVVGHDYIYGQLGDDGLYGAAGTDFVDGGSQSDGDITNGGSDDVVNEGFVLSPQTNIDTCKDGEVTEFAGDDGIPIIELGHKRLIEECEQRI